LGDSRTDPATPENDDVHTATLHGSEARPSGRLASGGVRTADPVPASGDFHVGEELDVELSHVVPGGHVLAHARGRTLFVRHGIPGERVRIVVTEVQKRAIRADVIAVHDPSPHRVDPPCRYAGQCGGCDWQHVELAHQRILKSQMLSDALRRQGRIDLHVPVEKVPGSDDGLRWRTRVRWQFDASGQRGFYRHRSHEVVPVDDCLITEVDAPDTAVAFSQVHRGIGPVLQATVVEFGTPKSGEHWWDLFGGNGLFAQALIDKGVRVDVIDTSVEAISAGIDHPLITGHCISAGEWVARRLPVDGVVVDPPRAGLGTDLIRGITRMQPRIVVMVSCDPVTFARDLSEFAKCGYVLRAIRAFDAFPMTKHVEIVAALIPQGTDDPLISSLMETAS